jgi:hypothetical protein
MVWICTKVEHSLRCLADRRFRELTHHPNARAAQNRRIIKRKWGAAEKSRQMRGPSPKGAMKQQPSLETNWLVLRPLLMADDLLVRELSNSEQIAELAIWPLSYCGRKVARRWISATRQSWADRTAGSMRWN